MAKRKSKSGNDEVIETKEGIKKTLVDIKRGNRVFAIMIVILVIMFAALMLNLKYNTEKEIAPVVQAQTFDELYQATLDGHETPNNYIYNGFVFIRSNILWNTLVTKKGGDTFLLSMHYDPLSVENVSLDFGVKNVIASKQHVALTTDDNLTARTVTGIFEVGRIIGDKYDFLGKQITKAIVTTSDILPTVTCANATYSYGVVYFHIDNETKVSMDDNGCVHVTGPTEEEIVRASDRLLFSLLNIISNSPQSITDFKGQGGLADWKDGKGYDGMHLIFMPVDEEAHPIAVEGSIKVQITPVNSTEVLESWETPLLLSYYNETGTANLYLSSTREIMTSWIKQGEIEMQIVFVDRNDNSIGKKTIISFNVNS